MILRTSASDLDVSSNPGVSIRRTVVPATLKGSEYDTVSVQESRSSPITRLEPEARLMNFAKAWDVSSSNNRSYSILTVDFPTPVLPITL